MKNWKNLVVASRQKMIPVLIVLLHHPQSSEIFELTNTLLLVASIMGGVYYLQIEFYFSEIVLQLQEARQNYDYYFNALCLMIRNKVEFKCASILMLDSQIESVLSNL